MSRTRTGTTALAGALALTALGVGLAPTAAADGPAVQIKYSVKVTGTTKNVGGKLLATCSAGKGGTCTLSKTYSVTRTIGTDLGISRGAVASSISFSRSTSASVTAACTSPKFSSNSQVYEAYAQGTRKYYKVTKKTYVQGMLASTKTSGTLSAFNPTGVKCVMR
ncbi:hypothetical protein HHL19_22360 [Streptomyces sp. R302]|uniref:hypothetical protein n=1 Tax=unclassified Streptomyces TaxID=2593676 RepID=UPI00145D1C65|nr:MULTISPECIES: hypothetical protein [unclassified Streptomyces]NML51705.1 hypothetical protein [Streptomyces sp. R301]NML81325.1 hypothetical protein [Streptomyces sp. R302]